MNTTQTISNFFKNREHEQHYYNLSNIPLGINNDEAVNWIVNDAPIKTLKLNVDMPYHEMFNEAIALEDEFLEHRSDGESHAGWKSLVLHGRGKHITQGDDQYDITNMPDMHWTDIANKCPITTNFLKNTMPLDKFLRVRFMLLEPGGYIMPHRDNNKNKLQAFNLALNNPNGCMFGMKDYGLIPWQPGDVRMINISTDHAVWNNSDTPRIHIIIHGWAKEKYKEYRDCIIKSYKQTCESYI